MTSIPIYQPTRRPTAFSCRSCANAFGHDEFGTFECRFLDDAANVEDDERETQMAVELAWDVGEPEHCPGWSEHLRMLCTIHMQTYLAEEVCMACEFEAMQGREPWEEQP